ncbi:MAG TPA: alpha/beta hydrolase [Nevskiaceae bacterium]|nr:alpha/beta hydrolase [Nevskiaceae bacterium]
MKTSTLKIAAPNGPALHTHRWLPEGDPRATLLIVHGMAEHGGRYARFAKLLTDAGIAVYALDLPGHGRTSSPTDLGHFANRNGWSVALGAIHAVHSSIAERDGKRPLFILGHSMGSFLVQHYLVEHGNKLDGAILSATNGDLGLLRAIGLALIRAEALIFGRRHRSALAEAMTFKEFNKKFKPNRTEFDWLSRDDAEVDKYIADPLCGFRCTTGLWIDLLKASARLTDIARLSRIPKTLPVLLIAGSVDPASNGATGPKVLEQAYRAAGLKDVTVSIYDGARHELLNETCRNAVMEELSEWIGAHL